MKITDEMLREAAPDACELWLTTLSDDLPEHVFSAHFEKKMEKLLRHPYRHRRMRSLLIAAVAAALLTMTVGATVLPPIRAFRSGVVHVLSQVLPKSTDQIYTTDTDHEGETRRPVLGWLPEGMVETKRDEDANSSLLNYDNSKDKRLIVYVRRIKESSTNTSSFDTEDAQVSEVLINGNLATLAVEKDHVRLIFFIDNYRCSLSGILTADEVVKIAKNIILK